VAELTSNFNTKKMDNLNDKASNEAQSQPSLLGGVSGSSLSDWRNDEYSNRHFDQDELEEEWGSSEAENCHCGAYKWSNGRWLHVSDCCC